MPRKQGQTGLQIPMSKAELEFVNSFARKRGKKITSDYVRALIEADMAAHGEAFTFEVDRGGFRERKETADS